MKRVITENRPKANYRGRSIFDTKHAIDRELLRYGRGFESEILMVLKRAIDKILDEYDDYRTQYVVHSRSTKIGVVIDWRPDSYVDDNINHCFIVTILKKSPYYYKKHPSDTMLITEIQQAFEERVDKQALKESEGQGVYHHVTDKETGLEIHLYEGEVYDLSAIVLEVE